MKDNCFTEFCCFLSNLNMNQPPVQFSRSVMSNSVQPHGLQHARPPCPSPIPSLLKLMCIELVMPSNFIQAHPISSSIVPFFSCPQSLPASESLPMSQLFTWGDQSTGASALASFPKKSQGWSPSEWTGWIFLQSKGPSRVFSNTTFQKHQLKKKKKKSINSLVFSLLHSPTLTSIHDHRKNHSLD